jgi:two-component system chemotaxis response regulator CheY
VGEVLMDKSVKILVVDDFESIRKRVVSSLRSMGMSGEIIEADCVDRAIELIEEHNSTYSEDHVKFVVSDLHMPGKSGIEFLIWFRKHAAVKDTPFLMLTTESEKTLVIDALAYGVSNYLLKPWEQADFEEKVLKSWDKHNS